MSRNLFPTAAMALVLGLAGTHAQAQDKSAGNGTSGDISRASSALQINELAQDVSRVEALRSVKDIQRHYTQYAQFGLWREMTDLFARDGTVIWGDRRLKGPMAIGSWLRARLGGRRGLSEGALHTEFADQPLVNLAVDGQSAKARWDVMVMAGNGKGRTLIEGGIFENEYVLEDGVWKIATLHYYPLFEGNYKDGWANYKNGDLPHVPYHFTIDESGIPIPKSAGPTSAASTPAAGASLTDLESRIAALNAEDAVRNLQNSYGYYVDQKMWDDVTDLFTEDGVVELADAGLFRGRDGVRTAMERMGEQGLSQGQVNDYNIFDTVVEVQPGNREAYARGIMLGMVGDPKTGANGWDFVVFRNRFIKDGGLWKIREMRVYPLVKADYAEGWGNGGTYHIPQGTMPAFLTNHPVTGNQVTIKGFTLAGAQPLTAPLEPVADQAPASTEIERYLDAKRRLARSHAFDGVVNVSAAYGYYLDDFQWLAMASIFAEKGNKHSPFAGFYLGQDRIKAAATAMYGEPPETRASIAFHWRTQPVIHVSYDGRSANLRTRLFHPNTTKLDADGKPMGSRLFTPGVFTGMYPNDQAVLENGIWRLWSLTIDEPYVNMNDWKGGWAAVEAVPPGAAAGQSPLVERLPPDILMTDLGKRAEHFRGGTGMTYQWPDILPMWFHYKNPVSGRVPKLYWPDSVPSLLRPDSRLINNGYQMPPNGPDIDGIMIELTPPEANEMTQED